LSKGFSWTALFC